MRTIILSILFTSLTSLTWGQYTNGQFLSIADFTYSETLNHPKSPNSFEGTWVGDDQYQMTFYKIGNVHLATITQINVDRPKFHVNEVVAVISYISNGHYRFSIRDQNKDGKEYVVNKTYAFMTNRFIDIKSGHIISQVNPTVDTPIVTNAPVTSRKQEYRNTQELNERVPAKKPPRAPSRRTDALVDARASNPQKYTPKKATPGPRTSEQRNNHFQNSPVTMNHHMDRTSPTAYSGNPNPQSLSRENGNTFFNEDHDQGKKRRKKNKGTLGKFLKGAGQLVMGAASAYAGTIGALHSVEGSGLSGGSPDMSKLASALGESLKKSSTSENSSNSQDILEKINSLLNSADQDKGLVSGLSELLKKTQHAPPQETKNQFDEYSKKSIDNFQKNYGDLLQKMGINIK